MTDNKLIIKVAESQGWTNIQRVEGYLMGSPARRPHARTNLPAYLTDANEWVKLLEEMKAAGTLIDIDPCPGHWIIEHEVNDEVVLSGDPSLARAVCLAWLAWKEAKA